MNLCVSCVFKINITPSIYNDIPIITFNFQKIVSIKITKVNLRCCTIKE